MTDALDMGYHFYHGIWDIETASSKHCFDSTLANYIVKFFDPPRAVLDLGCGRAEYLHAFHQAGWKNLLGVDGTTGIEEIAHFPQVLAHDLCVPLELPDSYDLVMCLEVGEHIPINFEGCLLDTIARCSSGCVLLSWAIEGQKGPGHINCRSNDYIIDQMKRRDFMYDPVTSNGLRECASLPWFKNTLMYFTRIKPSAIVARSV